MSLTIPQTFRTPIAQSIEAKDDGNCAERHPIYSTPSQLLAAIEAAEHVLFACGTLVEMAEHDLANARLAQRVSRDRVMELREQLMQMEANHA